MKFQGVLIGFGEISKFLDDLYLNEVARGVRLSVAPHEKVPYAFVVTLEATEDFWAELLEGNFKDGMLHHAGWHEKFKKI